MRWWASERRRWKKRSDRETDDWELAFTHAIHAHAAAVAGSDDEHRDSYIAARQAIDSIADDEDRSIVMETFNQVPAPKS